MSSNHLESSQSSRRTEVHGDPPDDHLDSIPIDKPSGNPRSSGGGKRGGKTGPGAPNPSSKSHSRPGGPKDESLSSTTDKILDMFSLKPEPDVTIVEMKPGTARYLAIADYWYHLAVKAKPEAAERLGRHEFAHVCRLLWTRRIEEVTFAVKGIKPDARQRAPVPRPVKIPTVIWDILKTIGRTEEPSTQTVYIPEPSLPNSLHQDDYTPEYETDVSTCVAQMWEKSWELVMEDRHNRAGNFRTIHGYDPPPDAQPYVGQTLYTLDEARDLLRRALDYDELMDNKIYLTLDDDGTTFTTSRPPKSGDILYRTDTREYFKFENNSYVGVDPATFTPPLKTEEAYELLAKTKAYSQRFNPLPAKSVDPTNLDFGHDAAAGHLGEFLRWDPQLWIDYSNFITEMEIIASVIPHFPTDVNGTMAWVLPVSRKSESTMIVHAPVADIPPIEIALAALLKSATWHLYNRDQYVANWFVEAQALQNHDGAIDHWVSATFAIPSATAPVYT